MEITQAELQQRQTFMLETIQKLGKQLRRLVEGEVVMELKPDGSKVTTADVALNESFIQRVEHTFPSDLVWGEEGCNSQKGNLEAADQNWMWLIDPIDGTSGFWRAYQSRDFTDCSAAIMITGFAPGETTPTLSAVHNPLHRLPVIVEADKQTGARLHTKRAENPKAIGPQPTAPRTLESVQRFEQNCWNGAQPDLRVVSDIFPYGHKMRTSSVGLAMGLLALGHIDLGAFPGPSNPHDVAPGALIAHAAGNVVQDLNGTPYEDIDWRAAPISGCLGTATQELGSEFLKELNQRAA